MTTIRNIILVLLFSSTSMYAGDKNIERYIEEYQYIAISEMERTGVPASIKLAQGILESNAGRSTLARKANNHFGIKCGSKWKGRKHYRKDDDYRNGKLVNSCFRVYKNAETSFLAHSDFLLDNKRYRSLFKLDPTDYKKWAKGLKKAGYATSKTYDKKLIRIIEDYQLKQYDAMSSADKVAKAKTKTNLPKEIFYVNDAKMTFAKTGETPAAIATRTKTTVSRILAYNELLVLANEPLPAKTKVFLQKKRRNFRGKQKTHIVLAGETMYDIAQTYGLRLDKLYKKNKMSKGTEPAIGESIRVRGRNRKKPRLRNITSPTPPPPVLIEETKPPTLEPETTPIKEDSIGGFKPVLTPSEKTDQPTEPIVVPPVTRPTVPTPPPVVPKEKVTPVYHTVIKGETLWRISQNYGTTVETIKQLNNLNSKIIRTGIRLRVK